MIKSRLLPVLACTALLGAAPATSQAEDMRDLVGQSLEILNQFQTKGPKIPPQVMAKAKALIFMKVTKGGLILAGQHGDGLIIARNAKYKWSGPVAMDSSGASFGLQAGGSVTRMVVLLNTDEAVNRIINNNDIKFVGEMEGKAGPDATEITDKWAPDSSVYLYSSTDGVYGGLSIKGVTMTVDHGVTNKTYSKPVSAGDVLNGKLPPPQVAQPLREKLASQP